jgi:hypothetical protein
MNNSPLYRLGDADFIKGAFMAAIAGVVVSVGTVMHGVITEPGFNVFLIEWGGLLGTMINNAVIGAEAAFSSYIIKNLLSDQNGAILGRWGGVKN